MASQKTEDKPSSKSDKATTAKTAKMWEYTVVVVPTTSDDHAMEDHLNGLGTEGWELVTTQTAGAKLRAIFKRRHRVA